MNNILRFIESDERLSKSITILREHFLSNPEWLKNLAYFQKIPKQSREEFSIFVGYFLWVDLYRTYLLSPELYEKWKFKLSSLKYFFSKKVISKNFNPYTEWDSSAIEAYENLLPVIKEYLNSLQDWKDLINSLYNSYNFCADGCFKESCLIFMDNFFSKDLIAAKNFHYFNLIPKEELPDFLKDSKSQFAIYFALEYGYQLYHTYKNYPNEYENWNIWIKDYDIAIDWKDESINIEQYLTFEHAETWYIWLWENLWIFLDGLQKKWNLEVLEDPFLRSMINYISWDYKLATKLSQVHTIKNYSKDSVVCDIKWQLLEQILFDNYREVFLIKIQTIIMDKIVNWKKLFVYLRSIWKDVWGLDYLSNLVNDLVKRKPISDQNLIVLTHVLEILKTKLWKKVHAYLFNRLSLYFK